ncbi:MAG: hypothetical protein HOE53_01645 [Candidatus Magasanikbacteria bacterium]|jgi:hypothetical protein|nr:hypothetical protein [Candidatus Magasanikbacteria bacterium]
MHHIGGTIKKKSKALPDAGKHYSSVPKYMDGQMYNNGYAQGIPSSDDAPVAPPYNSEPAAQFEQPTQEPITTNIDTAALIANMRAIREQLDTMMKIVQAAPGQGPSHKPALLQPQAIVAAEPEDLNQVEGVFNGEAMIGSDGKTYPVSANYASKSKLVEGDFLKLSLNDQGRFIYKQVGPTQRKHIRGRLIFDETSQKWSALTEGRMYRVLTASVTYHKGMAGDDVVLIVPENGESMWGAVEMIIKG